MFWNEPNLYGLTYRDVPPTMPFLGAIEAWKPGNVLPRFVPPFTPPYYNQVPYQFPLYNQLPMFNQLPIHPFGMPQAFFNAPNVPFTPPLHTAGIPPFFQGLNLIPPMLNAYRPFTF